MDTKLKNKFRIRRLIIAAAVVICSIIMICLYPYFGKRAAEYSSNYYEVNNFVKRLSDMNYVIYRNGINESGEKVYSPAELYLPNMPYNISYSFESWYDMDSDESPATVQVDDGFSSYVQERLNSTYSEWEEEYQNIRRKLDYRLVGLEKDQVLSTNVKSDIGWNADSYRFLLEIRYDERGKPQIISSRELGEDVINSLTEYLERNPMEDFLEGDIKYDSKYTFSGPKNCTFSYGLTDTQIADIQSKSQSDYRRVYPYYNAGTTQTMYMILTAFLSVLALVLPYLNLGYNGKEKLYSAYGEAAAIILFFALGNPGHMTVVADNNGGIWKQVLLEAGLVSGAANVLILIGNFLWWTVHFLVIYWAVSCLRMIFVMGPRRYLRERCYIYRIFFYLRALIGRMLQGIYRIIEDMERSTEANKTIFKIVMINFLILSAITILWAAGIIALVIYSIILYRILSKYYRDRSEKYRLLLKATNEIAEGNLDVVIDEDLGMFEPFKVEIQKIQQGFKKAVDEEVKSQRMKTDLISNVSHDLKTPLTAIITYVDLLKNEDITEDQRRAYVDVLDKKSMRLKVLIEDIFEISKATSQNVTLNLMEIDIVNLLKQVRLELDEKIEESNLDFRWNLPEHKIVLMLDSQKTFRIFENLLLNIVKYAMPGTRVYIDMVEEDGQAVIRMKNVSAVELDINPNDMTERFARGDQARNTEGSGLGLAIVKSFVELQKGRLELETEADLFKATIRWNLDKR